MAKASPDVTVDPMPTKIATATRECVCSGQPANFAGIAAVLLASVVLTAGHGNGDFTVGDGDTNGRKVRVAQQDEVPISNSGTATHIVLDDGSTLLYVTTCTSRALTTPGTVTIPAWDVEIADPT